MKYRIAKERFLQKHRYNRMDIKAALIDMDGVLFDSMPYHAQAWVEVMAESGFPFTQEDAYMNEGRTGKSTINELSIRLHGHDITDEEVEAMYAAKTKRFNTYPQPKPMPGAGSLLRQLQQDGIQPVLVTGSGTATLIGRLEKSYPGVFVKERMVTGFDVKYGKPNPEPYLMGLKKAGVEPWQAFVIENAPLGVKAGVAAGVFTIAVNTGPLADEVLLREGADLLFRSMEEFSESWPSVWSALQP
ncbi:MAG: HAD-IA family hydrolase [Bacteroidales bacterium]|nr:HAD-IA family hydrolase [Bacteroidales bacterium]